MSVIFDNPSPDKTRVYTDPRSETQIDDWPSGGKRVTAKLWIETDAKRGQRAVRATLRPRYNWSFRTHRCKHHRPTRTLAGGDWGEPKKLTYSAVQRIVDGSDGKTYIAALRLPYGFITIYQGNLQYSEEIIFPHDNEARFRQICALLDADPEPLIERDKRLQAAMWKAADEATGRPPSGTGSTASMVER